MYIGKLSSGLKKVGLHYTFFKKKIDLLLWDVQKFTWISIKTVPDTSLHETSDLI